MVDLAYEMLATLSISITTKEHKENKSNKTCQKVYYITLDNCKQ